MSSGERFGELRRYAAIKIVANTPSLKPTKINWAPKSEWKVEIPESLSPTGRRRRYFFNTKEEAQVFAREQKSGLRLYGVQGGSILPPREQEQASIALEAIKPFGVPLTRVVADWIERRREEKKALRFEEAMNLLIGSRSRSPSYLVSLRQTRNRMQILHDSLMCDLSPDDLSVALDGMSDAVRNFTLRIPWAVCVFAQRRGYCTRNLAKAVATAPVTPPETEVYRPGETVAYARSGDVLVCCKLYRVGGSLKDLIDTVNLLKTTGIGFRVLTRQLDATTPAGMLIFHVFGAIAEFEKSLI
jgi:hypothetical protein